MVLLIAMVFLGPERLPKAARDIGRAIAEFRRITSGVQADLRDAMGADEFRDSMESLRSVVDLKSSIKGELQSLTSSLTSSITDTSVAATGASVDSEGWTNTSTPMFDHSFPVGAPPNQASDVATAAGVDTPAVPPPDGMFVGDAAEASSGDTEVPSPAFGFDDVHPEARATDTRPRLGMLDSYDR